jgi:hypothetical protein
LSAIDVGDARSVVWPVRKQKASYASFEIEVEYAGGSERAVGSTLRHLPKPPDVKQSAGVATGRRWFSVASRALRLTAHETDLDYGPCMLSSASGTEIGIVTAFAQLVLPNGSVLPLWSKLKERGANGLVLAGRNDWLEWSLLVRADVASKGVGIELKTLGRKRLPGTHLEVLPFQTMEPMSIRDTLVIVRAPKEQVGLAWTASSPRLSFEFVAKPGSGLVALKSERFTLSPVLSRVVASIFPAERAIARS